MKLVYAALILLCMMTLTYAGTVNSDPKSNSQQTTQPNGQTANSQITPPAPAHQAQHGTFLSSAEADSLSLQSDSLLAQSSVGSIKVGAFDGNDLIYVLVVVLLVVVILAVVR
jgi:hypothetical protein